MNTYVMVGAGGTGTMLFDPLHTYLRAKHADDFIDFSTAAKVGREHGFIVEKLL